jgi:Tfp pilus assembly protein PilF
MFQYVNGLRRIGLRLVVAVCLTGWSILATAADFDRLSVMRKGIELHDRGDYQGALAEYQSVLATNPDDDLALHEMSLTYMTMQDYAACINVARRGAAIKSSSQAGTIAVLASCQDDAGLPKDALATFKSAVKKFPYNVSLNYNYGVSLARAGDSKLATKHLRVAIEQSPAYASPYLSYALVQKGEGLTASSTLMYLRFLMLELHSDRTKEAAAIAIAPFIPRPGDNNITVTLPKSGKANDANMMLELMLGVSRNSVIKDESEKKSNLVFGSDVIGNDTDADRTVVAMHTFFLTVRVMDGKEAALKSDFAWQAVTPLWGILAEQDVLTVFFYQVAALAEVDGGRQWLDAHPDRSKQLNAVLAAWKATLTPHP